MQSPSTLRDHTPSILVVGDMIAFVVWIAFGLGSHNMINNWLLNAIRVLAPFVIAWFVIAPFVGAYRMEPGQRGTFIARSALAWVLSISLGLALRATVFGEGFVPIFALVTFATTAVVLLGWRIVWAFAAPNLRAGR